MPVFLVSASSDFQVHRSGYQCEGSDMRLQIKLCSGILYLGLAVWLSACQAAEPCPECPVVEPAPCPTSEPCPDCEVCPDVLVADVPYEAQWASSGHADADSPAFRYWDDDGAVETACATCHSASGYEDFLGADTTAPGSIENTHLAGNGLTCVTCHNEQASALTQVTFPSASQVSTPGGTARCMVCHQGRTAGNRLEAAIVAAGLSENRDAVSLDIRFYNIHYYAAAATLYGSTVNGGYQYSGLSYEGKNQHVTGLDSCTGCHDAHTLAVKVDQCRACHPGIITLENLTDIRTRGSLVDYDGDGNPAEGIAFEINGLQQWLLASMQVYSQEITGTTIGYHPSAYPYFFNDLNANGTVDEEEAKADNAFTTWTARLLAAAYNYQTSQKDTGAYAHNPKYVIELLFDSTADLNSMLSNPQDISALRREDVGHFNAASASFRHWDAYGSVEARCARCHSADGLPTFLYNGVNIAAQLSAGFNCATCHAMPDFPALYSVSQVSFPGGSSLSFGEEHPANLCLNCHQGLESTASIDETLIAYLDDQVSPELRVINPHYLPAGATMFGARAGGAYQYAGQTYIGRSPHIEVGTTCLICHDAHSLQPQSDHCYICHPGFTRPGDIRSTAVDFDGDGDLTEGLASEITTLEDALLMAIQAYAINASGVPIAYDAFEYPYFYADANQNGVFDNEEGAYQSWTPRLIRATYNYLWVQNDPGAYAHNGLYLIQALYDSIADLGADVTTYTRP